MRIEIRKNFKSIFLLVFSIFLLMSSLYQLEILLLCWVEGRGYDFPFYIYRFPHNAIVFSFLRDLYYLLIIIAFIMQFIALWWWE